MKSSIPYLLPALLDWLVDSGCTPHLVLNTEHPDVRVPEGHSVDGQIVLNISPTAVARFELTREYVFFQTRFQGVPREIYAPLEAVLGIYARETGEGMAFVPRVAANIRPLDDAPVRAGGITKPRPKAVPPARDGAGKHARPETDRPRPSVSPLTPAKGRDAEGKAAKPGADGKTEKPGADGKRPQLRLVRSDEEDT